MKRQLVLALASALALGACDDDSSGPDAGSNQLVVGALLSITGGGATLGRTSEAALHLAADDVNARLIDQGSPTRVSLRIEDTGLDPATALERLRTLAAQGVRIFVGPQTSSEVAALKPFADSAGVVILSQGSTASSLSLPDDNVFRLVPDDGPEGQASAALADGRRDPDHRAALAGGCRQPGPARRGRAALPGDGRHGHRGRPLPAGHDRFHAPSSTRSARR